MRTSGASGPFALREELMIALAALLWALAFGFGFQYLRRRYGWGRWQYASLMTTWVGLPLGLWAGIDKGFAVGLIAFLFCAVLVLPIGYFQWGSIKRLYDRDGKL